MITGTSEDELGALAELRIRLDERRRPEQLREVQQRGRAAFLDGAEAESQASQGRALNAAELERITKQYP